ncbi:hypothetical protein NSQ97_17565, partial [Salmonella enterica]|nr:hypothetical protein [Salmonella enterica]
MLKMSAAMSLADIDNDIFLQRINASITRVRFALQSYDNFKQFVRIELDSAVGNDSNLLIVFYVQIMPDDFVMQLHR